MTSMCSMMGDSILGALQMEPTSIVKQIRLIFFEKSLEPKVIDIQKTILKTTW
jgi:hypothetical protein